MTEKLFHGFYVCENGQEHITFLGDVLPGYWIESHGVTQNKGVYYLQNRKYENVSICEMMQHQDAFLVIIKATFGMYTGVTAANGKVFTGDKLQWSDCYGTHTGIVRQEGPAFYAFTEFGKTALDIICEESRGRGGIQILNQNYTNNTTTKEGR